MSARSTRQHGPNESHRCATRSALMTLNTFAAAFAPAAPAPRVSARRGGIARKPAAYVAVAPPMPTAPAPVPARPVPTRATRKAASGDPVKAARRAEWLALHGNQVKLTRIVRAGKNAGVAYTGKDGLRAYVVAWNRTARRWDWSLQI